MPHSFTCLYVHDTGRYSTGGTLPTVTEIRRPVVTAQGEGEEEDEEDETVRHSTVQST